MFTNKLSKSTSISCHSFSLPAWMRSESFFSSAMNSALKSKHEITGEFGTWLSMFASQKPSLGSSSLIRVSATDLHVLNCGD